MMEKLVDCGGLEGSVKMAHVFGLKVSYLWKNTMLYLKSRTLFLCIKIFWVCLSGELYILNFNYITGKLKTDNTIS